MEAAAICSFPTAAFSSESVSTSCQSRRPTSLPQARGANRSSGSSSKQRLVACAAPAARTDAPVEQKHSAEAPIECLELHHVGLLCENLEKSLDFYCRILGLELNPARPEKKLPYRGAWLWVGKGMIHLMELPNPDPLTGRPEHGGRDRHTCITIKDVSSLRAALDAAGIQYTASKSGRPAVFTRDPDGNALEFAEPM